MTDDRSQSRLSPQLPLELALDSEATLDNFYWRENSGPFLNYLQGAPSAFEPVSYIHGAASVGKTHLLQALCHRFPGAVYLPLTQLSDFPPGALTQDLERSRFVAIDDVDGIAGRANWEEALFHLINRARAVACPLCFVGATPAADGGFELADLRSRLAGGLTWAIPAYSDEDKRAILAFRAQRRGLQLSPPVIDYLCSRDSRALPDLLDSLARLDSASLQLQRPVTVPLVRETMGW